MDASSTIRPRNAAASSFVAGLAVAALVALQPTVAVGAGEGVIALRGATVESMGPLGRIEGATIVVRDGTIEAIGADVKVPEEARIVDMTGKTLMPVVLEPYYPITIAGGEAAEPERQITFRGRTFRFPSARSATTGPFTRIVDNFYPYAIDFRPYLRHGVGVLHVVSNGQGQSALATMSGDSPGATLLKPDGMVYVAVTNDTSSLDVIRRGLGDETRGSGRPQRAGGRGGFRRGGPFPPRRGGFGGRRGGSSPVVNSPDTGAEQWKQVAEGQKPLVANINNSATALHLLRVLEKHPKVRLIVVGSGANLYPVLSELAERKVTLVLEPSIDQEPNTRNRICVARMAHEAGLNFVFSFALDTNVLAQTQDDPFFPIAQLVRAGLPRSVALKALTQRTAELLGVADQFGSLEAGKSASWLVFEGDPLQPDSRLRQVFVQGVVAYEG